MITYDNTDNNSLKHYTHFKQEFFLS